ncbi:Uridine kinase [Strongyloides ratti]|uniref:Uridine kinase n=1 Tax=Strongyloides ratti TaxID=34506 RepID=A0A090KNZ4_STRRB|nr:Uridine kinase [Strongyloides ratti]CEF59313.1 Uridine kinase [Strongyloides ratti]
MSFHETGKDYSYNEMTLKKNEKSNEDEICTEKNFAKSTFNNMQLIKGNNDSNIETSNDMLIVNDDDIYKEIGEFNEEIVKKVNIDDICLKIICKSSGDSINTISEKSGSTDVEHVITAKHLTKRSRTISGSRTEDHFMSTESGKRVYTKGRPPWYDKTGKMLKQPYLIGICGGSASGKTTVAKAIIQRLEMPWVTVLSMDSFYKVLNEEQHILAANNEYNFDHPEAFDFDLLLDVIKRLCQGKSVDVPVYDFTTHSRDKNSKIMYGADVLIFEGILAFHKTELCKLMDMKVFVDTDSDTRLARRLHRDVNERGRDVDSVLEQYLKHVKPAFDTFIAPGMKMADIIIPRGGENKVAIDLIVRQVKGQLAERGYDPTKCIINNRTLLTNHSMPEELPESLILLKQTRQIIGQITKIRNRECSREEFIFYSDRILSLLIEESMNHIPYIDHLVTMANGKVVCGRKKNVELCGISIMRAGETLEKALRNVIKDCKMGKMLIQTNEVSKEPELYYLRFPKNVNKYKILLLDATVASGAAAMMAIRILLDHDINEEDIILCSLLMAEPGVHALAYAFPKVKLVTAAIDKEINENFHVLPGLGNFGDRYYGTESKGTILEEESLSESSSDVSPATSEENLLNEYHERKHIITETN